MYDLRITNGLILDGTGSRRMFLLSPLPPGEG